MHVSKESQLDVFALAYDHYRILRDSAVRAEEYLNRVKLRGGETLENEFWIDLPEPTSTIGLSEIQNALSALTGELVLKMAEVKEHASKIVSDLKLTHSVDRILYDLAEAQRQEDKKKPQEVQEPKDELSPILDSLNDLPELGPDQQYDYVGSEDKGNGSAKAIWKIIDTPKRAKVEEKLKTKSTLHLRQRPKT